MTAKIPAKTSHGVPQCPSFGEAPLKPRDPVVNDGCLGTDYNLLFYWCRRTELNCGPTDYESVALPLSYAGR